MRYGGTAQRHCPRTTKAPASRQLSAGRTRYGSMAVRLASSRNPCRSRHSDTVWCPARHISYHQSCVCRCVGRTLEGCEARACRAARRSWMKPRGPAFSRFVGIVARTAFAVVNNLYCIPAYVVWMMVLRLVRPLFPPLYWKIEGYMYHWLLAQVSMWSWTAGYQIVESGDEPVTCAGRRTLVLANHQSTADVPMLMAAWNPRPDLLPNLMWIMDRVFKFTNFGIVSVLHKDFFIQAGKSKRDQSLEELRRHIHQYYMPLSRQFLVLFPEGGFLHKRREVSQRFAEKNNLPKLEYVSIPRAGAMRVIMEEIGPNIDQGPSTSKEETKKDKNFNQSRTKFQPMIVDDNVGDSIEWILDVTIAYPERIPLHLTDVVCAIRPACTTHMHYRLYPSTEVPHDPEEMTQWLYDRFIEKDKMLEEYYKTGNFPSKGNTPLVIRQVRQDNVRYLILHLFFIASLFIQTKFFLALWNLF